MYCLPDIPKTIIYEYTKTISSPNFKGMLYWDYYTLKRTKCRGHEIEYYEIGIKGGRKPLKIDVRNVIVYQMG